MGKIALALAAVVDRIGEIAVAAATLLAVVAVAVALPALMRRRSGGRSGLTPSLVILTGGAAITFVAWLAFTVRCSQAGCHVKPSDTIAGLAPWWRRKHSWQWSGQLMLASLGLVTASVALALAARRGKGARPAVLLARLCYAVWAVVVFVIPAIWEIFVI
jgi:hypothetical protein